MIKTIEEAAREYDSNASITSENFYSEAISDAFESGAEYIMSLPLASRLTAEEKERVKAMYSEAQGWLDEETSFDNPNEQLKICAVAIQDRLERIFGADFFKDPPAK